MMNKEMQVTEDSMGVILLIRSAQTGNKQYAD